MSSKEKVDVPTLRSAAAGMRGAADLVPRALPVDAGGCGSAAVIAAAESFNMWAKVNAQVLEGKLRGSASDANVAATAWEQAELEIAQNAQGSTP